MNVADSEVVVAILQDDYAITENIDEADLILVNTCTIRDNAEQRVWGRLNLFNQKKKAKPGLLVGVIGCMAERLKEELVEKTKWVDIVVGPDSYRDLPQLVKTAVDGEAAINVILSQEETYADINPVRVNSNGVSAFVSIMRGCDNMCTYCIVPYVRGRERSREANTILEEIRILIEKGYREVTLIGQNVDSYKFADDSKTITFPQLLDLVATTFPELRIRFATSHPKDMNDEVLNTMAKHDNICKFIHLPVQSGSSSVLKRMNRRYDREWYLGRIEAIKRILPDCAVSTDIMVGFPGETEEEFQDTLSLMQTVQFDFAYMFKYSERPGTYASKKLPDDIEEKTKGERLQRVIELQGRLSEQEKEKDLNKIHRVLAEGISKRSDKDLFGRNSQNKVVVFPAENFKRGDYVDVLVTECTSATLIGKPITN